MICIVQLNIVTNLMNLHASIKKNNKQINNALFFYPLKTSENRKIF